MDGVAWFSCQSNCEGFQNRNLDFFDEPPYLDKVVKHERVAEPPEDGEIDGLPF